MGEAFASHHSVFPDCYCSVCGSISGVRLQTSLEWCARWPSAGRYSGCSNSKFHVIILFLNTVLVVTILEYWLSHVSCRFSVSQTSFHNQWSQWWHRRKKPHMPVYRTTLPMGTTMAALSEHEAQQTIQCGDLYPLNPWNWRIYFKLLSVFCVHVLNTFCHHAVAIATACRL